VNDFTFYMKKKEEEKNTLKKKNLSVCEKTIASMFHV